MNYNSELNFCRLNLKENTNGGNSGGNMKKLLKHKWRLASENSYNKIYECERCGCRKRFDFDYDCIMYFWGTHVTYKAPDCLLPNTINYEGKII
jgi:hypothetical protein